jgi:hypothetical protein
MNADEQLAIMLVARFYLSHSLQAALPLLQESSETWR